jgi:hypothetical protein
MKNFFKSELETQIEKDLESLIGDVGLHDDMGGSGRIARAKIDIWCSLQMVRATNYLTLLTGVLFFVTIILAAITAFNH